MSFNNLDPLLGGLQRALDVRAKQHGLVSSNIANANTPGYRARRVDFREAMANAFGEGSEEVHLQASRAEHIRVDAQGGGGPIAVETIEPPAWAFDGNSVNREEELVILAENNLLYNATAEIVSRRLAMLQYAASDGGR